MKEASARELQAVIEELERKGQQLYLLKKSMNAPSRERGVVVSPEASRRKAAALKLLHEFRESAV